LAAARLAFASAAFASVTAFVSAMEFAVRTPVVATERAKTSAGTTAPVKTPAVAAEPERKLVERAAARRTRVTAAARRIRATVAAVRSNRTLIAPWNVAASKVEAPSAWG